MKIHIHKSIFVLLIIVTVWSIITLATDIVLPIFLPSPIDIFAAYVGMKDYIVQAISFSLGLTLCGFLIGTLAGVFLGLGIAYSRNFMETVGPILEFTRPVPVFALIPLLLLWFGVGIFPQILLIALGVSVVLGVSTYEAVKNIPIVYIRAAQNLGANKRQIFQTVLLPYITPHLIGAIRVGAALSWGLNVAAEFMGAQKGLGYHMIVLQIYLNTAGIIAIIFIYNILAIGHNQIIQKIEIRLTRWTERKKLSFEKIK